MTLLLLILGWYAMGLVSMYVSVWITGEPMTIGQWLVFSLFGPIVTIAFIVINIHNTGFFNKRIL